MQVFDGEEGLYEAESGVYDLILLDLMLPEKKWLSSLERIAWKRNYDTSSDHDCQGKFGWQGTWIWTGSGWLSDQTFLPRRTQNADSSASQNVQVNLMKTPWLMEILWLICQPILLKSKILLSNYWGKSSDLLVYFLQNQNVILPKTQIFDRLWGFDSWHNDFSCRSLCSKVRKN